MAVLNNTGILMGSSAVTAGSGDAYQIKKSLRSNKGDDPQMIRTPGNEGDKRTWTVSFWAKRCSGNTVGLNLHEKVFTAYSGADACGIRFLNDYVHFYHWDPDTYDFDLRTNALLRDPSAWYHIVCVYDSNNTTASERAKIYINGKLASLQTATYPAQYHDSHFMNDTNYHYLFRESTNTGEDYNGYIADFHFIDGLALTPAAFGSFDSTGNWNPKAFALPAFNANTTWSSGTITNEHSTYPVSNAFNGILVENEYWGPADGTASFNGFASFEPSNDIEFNQSLRIYADFDTRPATASEPYILVTTDTGGVIKVNGPIGGNVSPNGANKKWYTVQEGKGKLTKITLHQGALGYWGRIFGIEVDGVLLVDGRTDPTTRTNLNDGRTWSTYGTISGTSTFDRAVNGSAGGLAVSYASGFNSSWTWSDLDIPADTLHFWISLGGSPGNITVIGKDSGGSSVTVNHDPSVDDILETYVYFPLGNIKTINSIEVRRAGSGHYSDVRQIYVNGHALIDGAMDNSFKLDFSTTSLGRYVGLDTINGKIEDASGGLPIYKTTDDYGLSKGSGHRTDSNASSLILAVPGDAVADVSHSSDLRNSGSALSLTNNGTVAATTSQSHFYGSSLAFNGSDQWLDIPSTNTNNNNKFCIECWVKHNGSGELHMIEFKSSDSAGDYLYIQQRSDIKGYRFRGSSLDANPSGVWEIGSAWNHVAYTNDGSKNRAFVNGRLVGEADSSSWTIQSSLIGAIGASASSGHDQKFNGWLQDIRVYWGEAKYTAAFTPPKRNDWNTVTNLTPTTNVGTVYGSTMLSDGDTARFYDPDSNDAYGVASRFNMFDGSLSTRCGNPDSNNVFSWDTSSYSFSGLLEVYGANTSGLTNNIFVNDVDSGVDLPGTAGWTTVGTYNSGINKVHFSAAGGINIYAFRVAGTIITDTLEDAPKDRDLDSLTDTPTSYGEDTGAGGEVRGNYCTMNALDKGSAVTLTQGNLYVTTPSGNTSWDTRKTVGTMAMNGNKFYYEQEIVVNNSNICAGVVQESPNDDTSSLGFIPTGYAYYSANGNKYHNGADASYGNSYGEGDIISVAFDGNTGTLWFAKNGTWQNSATKSEIAAGTTTNSAYTGIATDMRACFSVDEKCESSFNFGQRPWKYPSSVPSGFKAVCTHHLPDTFSGDELNNPSKYFDITTWIGDSTERDIKGFNFGPDFVWIKNRNSTNDHVLCDQIRGGGNILSSSESYYPSQFTNGSDPESSWGSVKTFNSDGFTLQDGPSGYHKVNLGGQDPVLTYIGWAWDTGTAAVTPSTAGTINPTDEWVNTDAGFSIIRFTSPDSASAQTVGHSLNAVPHFIISKNLENTYSWEVWHKELAAGKSMNINATDATSSGRWGSLTNTTFGTVSGYTHYSTHKYINYLWTEIPGYSKFGKYDGNSAKPFIYTGFRPKLIIIKATTSGRNWIMIDNERFKYNADMDPLYANSNVAEQNHNAVDIVSNGFKIIDDGYSDYNVDADLIYAAWAEHPFKTARAR